MKMYSLIFAAFMAIAFASCSSSRSSADKAPITDAFHTTPSTGANYGAGVASRVKPVSYTDLMSKLSSEESVTTAVEGTVLEVCQKKGCWMTIQPVGGEEVTVRFKDYGFFMPKTLSGSKVLVEGTAKRSIVSVDDLRHYAEDAGKSADEIAQMTEPKEEIEFTATGVRVL